MLHKSLERRSTLVPIDSTPHIAVSESTGLTFRSQNAGRVTMLFVRLQVTANNAYKFHSGEVARFSKCLDRSRDERLCCQSLRSVHQAAARSSFPTFLRALSLPTSTPNPSTVNTINASHQPATFDEGAPNTEAILIIKRHFTIRDTSAQ